MIRVLIADADEASRESLRRLVNRQLGWRVCGEAATGPEAVALAQSLSPGIAAIDLALPELDGLRVVRRIKQARPETEILVLTAHEADDLIHDILIAGARACLLKSDCPQHLVPAIDALSRHRPYLTPTVTDAVLDVFLAHGGGDRPASRPYRLLTARQREILQLLAEGRSNAAIAARLAISVKTVESHRATMMKRLGVSSLAELIRYAIRNSVIEDA